MKPLLNELRQRVTVQFPVRIEDQQGGFQEEWQDKASIWIKLTPLASSVSEGRGYRQGTLEGKSRHYQGVARASVVLKKGFRFKKENIYLTIVEEPYLQGLYLFFNLSTVLESDGGDYE